MKTIASILSLSLVLVSGAVLAHEEPKTTTKPSATMDHSKMDMSGKKSADHEKMAAEEFVALDKNKDGKLSKAEVPAENPLAAHFGALDTDKDGSLSKAEFAKHHEM